MSRRAAAAALVVAAAFGCAEAEARVEAAAPSRPLLVTVDDLPIAAGKLHPDPASRAAVTDGLLAALRKHGIHAVGFVTWQNVRSEADRGLLRRWLAAGHELGNHTNGHLDYTRTSSERYIADAEAGRAALQALLTEQSRTIRFFRFPFLREGETPEKLQAMRAWLAKTGQRNMPVTIDDQDWSYEEPWVAAGRRGGPDGAEEQKRIADDYHAALRLEIEHHEGVGDALFDRVTPQVLLLHANAIGAAEWDRLFTWLEETGHRFAAADEVLADPAFADPPAYVGDFGCSLWDRIRDGRRRAEAEKQVRGLLERQIAAWNRGDLDEFCSIYAADAAFLSPSGYRNGRDEVLARYRRDYPDRAAMGRLTLDITEVRTVSGTEFTLLGDAVPGRVQGVTVLGRWRIERDGRDPSSGGTLVVFRRAGEGWELIQDASF